MISEKIRAPKISNEDISVTINKSVTRKNGQDILLTIFRESQSRMRNSEISILVHSFCYACLIL